jgi:predicted transcriptional regulator
MLTTTLRAFLLRGALATHIRLDFSCDSLVATGSQSVKRGFVNGYARWLPVLTGAGMGFHTGDMNVQFSPEIQAKLDRAASEQGRNTESLIQEAVERLLNYDEWFARQVEEGLSAADRGEFVEHDEVRKLIDSRYSG